MRLIDADKLKKKVLMWMPSDPCGIAEKERPIETDIAVSLMMEIDDAPTVDAEPKWIPCSERLPEDSRCVLVSIAGDIGFGSYDNGDWRIWNDSHWNGGKRVDAWTPLPEPYEGGDDDA